MPRSKSRHSLPATTRLALTRSSSASECSTSTPQWSRAAYWPQLGRLRAACAFPYLLVEGTDIDRGPLHHNAVRGACLAVIDQGIALLRSGYQRDSALWIHRLAVRCQEIEPAAERPAYAQRPRPKPGDETAEALLAAVPGISTTSARALLERFGSVAAVVAADPAEWGTVPGIGPERARALEETFNLRRSTLI